MAAVNVTRYGETAQKKAARSMVFHLTDALMAAHGITVEAGSFSFKVATLPANSLVQAATVLVNKATAAASTAVLTVGTTESGAQLLAATDTKTVGAAGTIVKALPTGTGMDVYVRLLASGATTSVGDLYVVLDYLELEKNTGEYTNYSN